MNILLFAGTAGGRLLADRLAALSARLPVRLIVRTATEYGAEVFAGLAPPHAVSAGRLDAAEMADLMRAEKIDLAIDATHPYAAAAAENIREAATAAGAARLRLARAAGGGEDAGECGREAFAAAEHFPGAADAAAALAGTEGNVLLATGVKTLGAFSAVSGFAERLFVRVLPAEESLRACAELGFPRSHVIAMQGPFSREMNRALLRQLAIRILVTKDGGAQGGFAEKILAAADTGVRVFVIDRPRGKQEEELSEEQILAAVARRLEAGGAFAAASASPRTSSRSPSFAPSSAAGTAIALVGAGMGAEETLTREAEAALLAADAVIGAPRLLAGLAGTLGKNARAKKIAEALPEKIAAVLAANPRWRRAAVLLGGDPGFFSGAKKLLKLFSAAGGSAAEAVVIPGISTPQYFAAKLRKAWQSFHLVSAHGRGCDILAEVLNHPTVLFLADGKTAPAAIAAELCAAGLGGAGMTVAENLAAPDERLARGPAADFAAADFAPLSVVLVENTKTFVRESSAAGIPDGEFLRGDVPMTKREVRAAALSLLAPRPADIVYDIGVGTGSVSVELALAARRGRVYAVDGKESALALLAANREKFGAYNIVPVRGAAPDALENLPPPAAAFIGGSNGNLPAIAESILRKNPRVRIAVAAATLETLAAATEAFRVLEVRNTEIVQIAAVRVLPLGGRHMLTPQTPVFLIAGGGE